MGRAFNRERIFLVFGRNTELTLALGAYPSLLGQIALDIQRGLAVMTLETYSFHNESLSIEMYYGNLAGLIELAGRFPRECRVT